MRKQLLTLLLAISFPLSIFSQTSYIDSLHQAYDTESDDIRFKTLYRYCYAIMQMDTTKTKELIANGKIELSKSKLTPAKKAYHLGLFAEVSAMMAINTGNSAYSLEMFQRCLEYAEQSEGKDKYLLRGNGYWGKGVQYGQQGLFEKSIAELLKAKAEFLAADQPGKQADCYAQIAQGHHQMQQFDSTIFYINLASDLIDPKLDITNQYYYNFFKANAFNALEQYDSTIALLSIEYLAEAKDIMPAIYAHLAMSLADAYSIKKVIPQARKLLSMAKSIVDETDEQQLRHNYLASSLKFEKASKNYKAAFKALDALKIFEDSLHQSSIDKNFMELQSKYEAQAKDFEIKTLESKNSHQQNIMWLGGIFFSSLLGVLFFWFKNLEEKRKAIHEKNNQQIRYAFKYDAPEIKDDFLKKITQYIHDNIDNKDFLVDDLVRHSGMNRNAMNKKLKAMTNKTAVKLIREIRLEKAKSLLMKNGKNISEIAFEVGFKDPNYFSVCFKDQFGVTPSDVLKKAVNH